jgi:hypothetical protein
MADERPKFMNPLTKTMVLVGSSTHKVLCIKIRRGEIEQGSIPECPKLATRGRKLGTKMGKKAKVAPKPKNIKIRIKDDPKMIKIKIKKEPKTMKIKIKKEPKTIKIKIKKEPKTFKIRIKNEKPIKLRPIKIRIYKR